MEDEKGNLILTLNFRNQIVMENGDITIELCEIDRRGRQAKIAIKAPKSNNIYREERSWGNK